MTAKAAGDVVRGGRGSAGGRPGHRAAPDCFAINELISSEALGLCEEGEAGWLIDEGEVSYGGKWVVNPSSGLISEATLSAPRASPSARS